MIFQTLLFTAVEASGLRYIALNDRSFRGSAHVAQSTENMVCCVQASYIDRFSECAVSSESSCTSDACIWTTETECVSEVYHETAVGSSSDDMTCCVSASQIDRYTECDVTSENLCSSDACSWISAGDCISGVFPGDSSTTSSTTTSSTAPTNAPIVAPTDAPTNAPTATEAVGSCLEDVAGYDCDTEAWGWNCGAAAGQGYCPTLTNCPKTCVERTGQSCDYILGMQSSVCGGSSSGGSSGSGEVSENGCQRGVAGSDFAGYQIHFDEARDGSYTQEGDYITVTKARPTPSWCIDTSVAPPQVGETLLWSDFFKGIGLHKLACLGWTAEMHAASTSKYASCEAQAPGRTGVYSYDAFAQAVGYFPDFAGYESYESSALDLAAFMAHSSKETMGGEPISEQAWCWINEMGYTSGGGGNYGLVASPDESCVAAFGTPGTRSTVVPEEYASDLSSNAHWNDGYWGRGSIQLSYCYNYGHFTNWVELELGIPKVPETDFYANPGFVATKDWAFAAGLWFYMSPSSDGLKPSMHSVVNFWESGQLVTDQDGRISDIGLQVNILNGGIECGANDSEYAQLRLESLNDFMGRMNYPGAQNGSYLYMPHLQINGCTGADNFASPGFMNWEIDGLYCSGDSINVCEDDAVCPTY